MRVPANAVARVLVPVPAGTTSVYEDGRVVSGSETDGYLAVTNVQPGCHVFTTDAGLSPYLDDRLTSVCAGGPACRSTGTPRRAWAARCPRRSRCRSAGPGERSGRSSRVSAADIRRHAPATVTSTAGDATLSVQDPELVRPGHLVNGAYALAQPLQVAAGANAAFASVGATPATLRSYGGPVSNDPVTVAFKQTIGATEPLRTGSYGKPLTFTLSTDNP